MIFHGNYIKNKAQGPAKIILSIYAELFKSICMITFCHQFYAILNNFYRTILKNSRSLEILVYQKT